MSLEGKKQQSTRAKIALLQSAIKLFGEKGLEGTSTREISRFSGQNIAAITYYFGSKDGLYMAVAQWVADTIKESSASFIKHCTDLLECDNSDSKHYIAAILQGVDVFLNLLARPESVVIGRFMSREQLNPTKAYALIHEQCIAPLHRIFVRLISAYTGLELNDIRTILHTHATIGNVLAFLIARETIRLEAGWGRFGSDEIFMIKEVLHERTITQLMSLRQTHKT